MSEITIQNKTILETENQSNASENNKRIAKNSLYLYFRMIIIMGVTLYTSRVVLNALGVVNYGIYNVVGGVVSMFAFLNTALAQATQRYISFGIGRYSIKDQCKNFSMLLNVHIIIALILFLLCETVGVWLLFNKLVIPPDKMISAFWVMQCSILSLIVSVTQVPYNASIFGHERMNAYAYISFFEVFLKLCVVLLVKSFFYNKLLAYGILVMLMSVIIAMTYRAYCIRFFNNCHYVRYWSKNLFKEIFNYTSWSLLGNLAWTLNSQGINFLINIFFGPVFNATRGIASQVEAAVTSFLTNFLGASIPPIIKLYAAGDIERMLNLNEKSSKFGFLLFMCLSLPLIGIINKILSVWLLTSPNQTGLFCMLSLIYIQCNSLGGTLQNVIQATGNVKSFQLANGIIRLVAMPIVYILYKMNCSVSIYLYVLIITSFFVFIASLIIVNKEIESFSVARFLKNVTMKEIFAYVLPFLASIICYENNFNLTTSIFVCIGLILLTISSAWIIGLSKQEQIWFINIIKSKLFKVRSNV